MSFSTLFFLAIFLPLFLLCYGLAPRLAAKNRVFLLFSLIFYAFSGVQYLLLAVGLTLLAYLLGRLMEQYPGKKKTFLVLGCVVLLAALGIFKYTNFVLGTVGAFVGKDLTLSIALPLGISFYSFKLISYLSDVYHERIPAEHRFQDLLLFAVNFQTVTQGPIIRYEGFYQELHHRVKFRSPQIADGTFRFCVGLAKKVLLADHMGEIVDAVLPVSGAGSAPVAACWAGAVCYSLQLYLDFSAYSDMAIGLGQMIGFHFMENFNYPYIAKNVRDFWRRWHISLSSFFRDYVYIPLGGSRVSFGRLFLNVMIVWALTGLWHGASWNFVLWGLYYGILVMIENLWKKKVGHGLPAVLGHIYTIFVFVFGWVLFRFSDFTALRLVIRGLFGGNGQPFITTPVALTLENNLFFLIFCVLASTPVFRAAAQKIQGRLSITVSGRRGQYLLMTALSALLLVLCILAMAGQTYTPFLYNQF